MSLDSNDYCLKEINELCELNSSSYSKKDNWEFINYLDTKNIIKGEINEIKYLDPEMDKVPSRAKRKVNINDIIISTVRPNQEHYGIIKKEYDNFLVSTGFTTLTVDTSQAVPEFIYYYITQHYITQSLQTIAEQSTTSYPSVKPSDIGNLIVELPSLDIQNKIANILTSIENKINVNKEINKNLEELMHVLFKKYFIDNNPFYVENDEKWNIIKLKDLIIRNRDKINDFDNWKDELLIDLSNMPRFSIAISNFDKGKKFTSNIYKLNKYDLLFGSIRPYFGKVGFSPINGVVTGTVHSFKPIDDIYYSLVLSLISSKTFINYTVSVSKGTKMPSVKWDDFINYEFAIPDDLSKIGEYNKILLPLIHKIEKNILEIQRLTKLRDTLLPKLMSGEIDVSKINCDLKIIIRKIYIKSSKLFLWRYLSENQNHIKNTKSNETLLKSRAIHKINKFLAKFNAR